MSSLILCLYLKVDQIIGLSLKSGKGTWAEKEGFFDVNLNFELQEMHDDIIMNQKESLWLRRQR